MYISKKYLAQKEHGMLEYGDRHTNNRLKRQLHCSVNDIILKTSSKF